ncbi:methylated-DNA--[protein]-cysteine S-methyltransferase [Nonomuraea typhae]|uniref:Methylated-DNA--protein-cysteine methyltransferase n=1 Tax=Nonomuraea typhae TaxID=2603600 RepID=A0ABW7YRF7_9ACTN
MIRTHTVIDSPVGPLTLVALDGLLTGVYMREQRYRPPQEFFGHPDPEPFGEVTAQLGAYFAGTLKEFDLPMNLVGTPFQKEVWAALQQVPFGETLTYGGLAERLGRPPSAARAVGSANGHNPVSIIIPCHRLVGANGDLTGYGGGLPVKRYLLDLERGTLF